MREDIKNYTVGALFIVLGALLLISLTNLIDSGTIYGFVVPAILVFSGIVTISENSRYRQHVSIGLIITGALSLIVRLNIIQGDFVNVLLGASLLLIGASIVTKAHAKKVQNITPKNNKARANYE
jgi:hypothetical protein